MTKDEALKLALDALEVCEQSNYGRNWVWPDTAHPTAMKNVREAITAIKEALAQRTWIGLTDEDRLELAAAQHGWEDLCLAVEAKLKQKNT